MSIFHRKPRRDAKFVYVALDGEQHKAHLWPGDTFEIKSNDGQPVLRIRYIDGAWHVEQQTPSITLDREIRDWVRKQPA